MEDKLAQQILTELKGMRQDIGVLKEGQQKLEQGQQKLEQGQQKLEQKMDELEEQLMAQGHKLSLEIRDLKLEHGKKLNELLEANSENRVLFDNHEPRIVKLEDIVTPLKEDVDFLKKAHKATAAK